MPVMNTASNSSPLAGVHGHQLHGVLPGLGLVVAGLQRGVGQEGGQRRHDFARVSASGAAARPAAARSGSSPWLAGLCVRGWPCSSSGRATASLAEALLRDEALGGVDQFLQVLDAVLAFLLGAVVLQQAAGCSTCSMISRSVRPWVCSRSTSTRAGRVLQRLDAARADAARREVHHAQEAGVVVGVLEQAQVGQRVLDLGALEEAQAAIHAVGQAGVEQRDSMTRLCALLR
jgi:hypothetical protein